MKQLNIVISLLFLSASAFTQNTNPADSITNAGERVTITVFNAKKNDKETGAVSFEVKKKNDLRMYDTI